jgi:hypothetical protein
MPDADANVGERKRSLTNPHFCATLPVTRGDRASASLGTNNDDVSARISDRRSSNMLRASEDTESITRISDRSSSNVLRAFRSGAAQIIIPDPYGMYFDRRGHEWDT